MATMNILILLGAAGVAVGMRSNVVDVDGESLAAENSPADCKHKDNPGCHGLAGKCCPNVRPDGVETMLACCSQGKEKPHVHIDEPKPHHGGGSDVNPHHSGPKVPSETGKYDGPVRLQYYAYRATKGSWDATAVSWATAGLVAASANLANAAGVLRYIHNEVVGVDVAANARPPKCERKNGIDRIARYKVWMHNTQEVYDKIHGQFAPFRAMDYEMCSVPGCTEEWKKWGYVVGCQNGDRDYPGAVWYSFPGRCPSMKTGEKTAHCVWSEPGGSCYSPDGSHTCTYHYVRDGEVTLDELSGIDDYRTFCMDGGIEFKGPHSHNDDGVTIEFWKDYGNSTRNHERTQAMLEKFKEKYGLDPKFVEEPRCDAFR